MKQIKLTKKQELVLNYIKEYTAEHGFPPAVREIAKGVGLNSPSSVHSHIKRLERDGYIKKTNSKFRTLEVVGINEFKVSNGDAIKLKVYNGNLKSLSKEVFEYPSSRIPKNEEIFALKLNSNILDFKKNDILIITKPKNYFVDDLVITNQDDITFYKINDKNDVINKNLTIYGKVIELSRKF